MWYSEREIAHGVGFPRAAELRLRVDALRRGAMDLLGLQVSDSGHFVEGDPMTRPFVVGVAPSSPAGQIGFEVGDVIMAFAGQSISSLTTLADLVLTTPSGRSVSIDWVDRLGTCHSAQVTLEGVPST